MKKKIKKLFYPQNYMVILGIFIITISLIYLICFDGFNTPLSYILYLLMTYSLIIICIKLYSIIKLKFNILITKNKYLNKYKNDYKLRYKISLLSSILFNIMYATFKLISGIIFKSIWFITFALYYLLLIILRTSIAKQELSKETKLKDEYIKYRFVAIILLFTNVILTMIILVIVNQKIMNIYPSWIAISIAVYTFYLLTSSIYNLLKYHKYKSPLISASKVINVITSLVSLISLEIVLIPTFGIEQVEFFEIMIMATGGGVALVIIIISLYMIINSTEWLNNSHE